MLASLLGVRLMVWAGAGVPRPLAPSLMPRLVRTRVINDETSGDAFELSFRLRRTPLGDVEGLNADQLQVDSRVVIGVAFGATMEALINGVVLNHQYQPTTPGGPTLAIQGRDVSALLDREERDEEFPNQPDSVIATRVIARHASAGLVPIVTPTAEVPIQIQRIPRQHKTDLAFLRDLAQRNGYVFFTEPMAPGVTAAHFGPAPRAGVPQPALTYDMGSLSNLMDVSIGEDPLAGESGAGTFQDPLFGLSIPIPPLPSLRLPPLAAAPASPLRRTRLRDTASQSPGQAAVSALARSTNAADAVSARGTVDAIQYGRALRARRLVGLRGVGLRHDGLYIVRAVSHEIRTGAYTQQFQLRREGTGSLLPLVPP